MTFVEKPKRPYPPPGQEPPPTLPRWSGNQRSHQNEDLRRKQNPGNNSANRSNFSWSRQDKNMSSQPFKPLTCFCCRKDGHMISNCPEKLKMTRQQHNADTKPTGVIATSLSLPDVGEIRHFLQVFAERLTQLQNMVLCSKKLQVLAKSTIFHAFSRNEALFAKKFNQTRKHGSFLEKVSTFPQIDDFSRFFGK